MLKTTFKLTIWCPTELSFCSSHCRHCTTAITIENAKTKSKATSQPMANAKLHNTLAKVPTLNYTHLQIHSRHRAYLFNAYGNLYLKACANINIVCFGLLYIVGTFLSFFYSFFFLLLFRVHFRNWTSSITSHHSFVDGVLLVAFITCRRLTCFQKCFRHNVFSVLLKGPPKALITFENKSLEVS